jgi:hypothetical protein
MISISGLAHAASGPQAAEQISLSDPAVEGKLAQHNETAQRVVRHRPDCGHESQRDRQIVSAGRRARD